MPTLKRTSLYEAHVNLGARLIEFGGWEMPVQYTGIMQEHLAVRSAAGLFDIAHMGEVGVSGAGALEFLNHLLTNDVRKLVVGQAQYTLMCNPNAGVIDDLYVYRVGEQEFLLIINASRIEPDIAWMQSQWQGWPGREQVNLANLSDKLGAIALQGPRSVEFIDRCFEGASKRGTQVNRASELKKNQMGVFDFGRFEVQVARTGYTGEDGFELIAEEGMLEAVWNRVLETGKPFGCVPAGLGARDTLRTEVCYPLYGHELDEQTTPLEAGLGFFVAMDKPAFIGRNVLLDQKTKGVTKKCVAFKMTEKSAPPRPHYAVWSSEGVKLGEVTSGTQSPSLNVGIGLAYVPPSAAQPGNTLQVEIRGKRAPAVIVPKPIYRKT